MVVFWDRRKWFSDFMMLTPPSARGRGGEVLGQAGVAEA